MAGVDPIPRIVFCGAVDDGKSTVLGRLLAETQSVSRDELASAEASSNVSFPGNDEGIDYSLLVDGLESERQQGITIDVTHRHLNLGAGRRAIVIDSPGHVQYTRNMAVASAAASIAVVIVDSSRGIRPETIRFAAICLLMGIPNLVVAVNKLDTSDDALALFQGISSEFETRLSQLDHDTALNHRPYVLRFVPLSGLRGDNVTRPSERFPWKGETLLSILNESVDELDSADVDLSLRLPIQSIIRHRGSRYYSGRVAAGSITVGQSVRVWPSGAESTVEAVSGPRSGDGVVFGRSITVKLAKDLDLARGDILVDSAGFDSIPSSRAHLSSLIWLSAQAFEPHSSFLLKCGPVEVPARIESIRAVIDPLTGQERFSSTLAANDLARVEITANSPLLLDPYLLCRETGGFILINRRTGETVAAGMSIHPLRRESEVTRHAFKVTRAKREELNGYRACVLWLTGLPGSGKSTFADALESSFTQMGVHSYVLDGDTVRQTVSDDLGFSPADRAENVRRVSQIAGLLMDAGLVVIVSLVSPYRRDRETARELFARSDFAEVFVDTPLEICVARDSKGLYGQAATDDSSVMTGIGQPYEAPEAPDFRIDGQAPVDDSIGPLLDHVMSRRL